MKYVNRDAEEIFTPASLQPDLVVVILVVLVLAVVLVLVVLLVVLILVVLTLAVLAVLRVAIVVLIVVVHDSSFPLPLQALTDRQHLFPGVLHVFTKLLPPVGY